MRQVFLDKQRLAAENQVLGYLVDSKPQGKVMSPSEGKNRSARIAARSSPARGCLAQSRRSRLQNDPTPK